MSASPFNFEPGGFPMPSTSRNLIEKRKRMSDPKRQSEILLYSTPDGDIRVEVTFEDETFWLTQKKMSELFGVGVPTINHHLREIFNSNELNEMATIRKFRIVQTEGSREVAREVEFYNLDAIIAVGYRVNSREANCIRRGDGCNFSPGVCRPTRQRQHPRSDPSAGVGSFQPSLASILFFPSDRKHVARRKQTRCARP